MNQKKPYAAPKIFQVELNQEQAILTTCATGTTNVSSRTTAGGGCSTACKKFSRTSGAAAHPS